MSKCCGAEVRVVDEDEFASDVARGWREVECQECGEIAFEDEEI